MFSQKFSGIFRKIAGGKFPDQLLPGSPSEKSRRDTVDQNAAADMSADPITYLITDLDRFLGRILD